MKEERYLGVDGCKAGWFFVAIGTGANAEFGVFESIEKLFNVYSDAKSILIDIPIGLPTTGNEDRSCDKEARKVLSPKRHNSIFSPPCREVFNADSFTSAGQINKEILGKGITQHYPPSSSIFKAAFDRYPSKEVARDDILDALALAITAFQLEGRAATLPPKRPERDNLGLPMEMVYSPPECSKVQGSRFRVKQ